MFFRHAGTSRSPPCAEALGSIAESISGYAGKSLASRYTSKTYKKKGFIFVLNIRWLSSFLR
jgi:hypothetical protein